MKILRAIIESAIVCALCYVFFEVVNNISPDYSRQGIKKGYKFLY
jgi:ABC-type amino acid transport system permease subunit